MPSTAEDNLQRAFRLEKAKIALYHTAKMVGYVRGFAKARGYLNGGDWDLVDKMTDDEISRIIGNASDEDAAIARVSLHLDEQVRQEEVATQN